MIDILIPCKHFAAGKSRLAPALPRTARAELCRTLLRRSIATALDVVGSGGRVAVISPDRDALDLARSLGAVALADPGRGLNEALALGERSLGAERALIVLPIDLPWADASSVGRLVESGRGMAIAPDGARLGTNALGLGAEARRGFPFAFGDHSFDRHLDIAGEMGLLARVASDPKLAFDLDTPADLLRLEAAELSGLGFRDIRKNDHEAV